MKRTSLFASLILLIITLCALALAQDSQPVPIKIRAALFDRDLNIKPVPRLQISLRSLDTPNAAPVELHTTLDGTAEVSLAPGRYQLTTTSNAELFGKNYRWDFPFTVAKAGQVVELSNDNAATTDSGSRSAHVDELIEQFRRVRGSVVTVFSERSAHDGTLIDAAGLILTAHIPSDQQHWLAVRFDGNRVLAARVVADDEKNDATILRMNPEAVKDVQIPLLSYDRGALLEGERVFSMDNTPDVGKSIRTGVISKSDATGILGDVQFTDIGSPLFNSSGTLVAYSRVADGKITIVSLDEIRETINATREKAKKDPPPPARLLPVSPGKYPAQALLERHDPRYEKEIYDFKMGDFNVFVGTPVANYQWAKMRYEETLRERQKRAKGQPPAELKVPAYEYQAIIVVQATPDFKAPFWANAARTPQQKVVLHPKASFSKLRLLCGEREVEPIRPRRYPMQASENAGYRFDQDSMSGEYAYTPDSLPPTCAKVTLEIYSADQPDKPVVKVFDPAFVNRLWQDFEPFRKTQAGTFASPPVEAK